MSQTAVALPVPRVPARRESLRDLPVDGPKKILLAAPRGYCAGVDRAVITVEKSLRAIRCAGLRAQADRAQHPRRARARGEGRGVRRGGRRGSRGRARRVQRSRCLARRRRFGRPSAGCRRSTRPARSSRRCTARRSDSHATTSRSCSSGHEGHEEVEGTAGEAPEHVTIVNNPDEADTVVVQDPSKLVWLSQTTLSVDETMETVNRLRARFPKLQDPPSDDICYATQNRQVAIKKVAADADLVIVVGSDELVQQRAPRGGRSAVRREGRIPRRLRRRGAAGMARRRAHRRDITSGASVPDVLVQQLHARARGRRIRRCRRGAHG